MLDLWPAVSCVIRCTFCELLFFFHVVNNNERVFTVFVIVSMLCLWWLHFCYHTTNRNNCLWLQTVSYHLASHAKDTSHDTNERNKNRLKEISTAWKLKFMLGVWHKFWKTSKCNLVKLKIVYWISLMRQKMSVVWALEIINSGKCEENRANWKSQSETKWSMTKHKATLMWQGLAILNITFHFPFGIFTV